MAAIDGAANRPGVGRVVDTAGRVVNVREGGVDKMGEGGARGGCAPSFEVEEGEVVEEGKGDGTGMTHKLVADVQTVHVLLEVVVGDSGAEDIDAGKRELAVDEEGTE